MDESSTADSRPSGGATGGSSSGVTTVQGNNLMIDVVKFDGTNNLGMCQCEVLDALLAQSLEETVELKAKPTGVEDGVWTRKNRLACGVIRTCLTQDIKYSVMKESSAKKIWDILEGK